MAQVKRLFSQIESSGEPASLPEVIFRAYQRGEMSKEDYEIKNAIWTAENIYKYVFRSYPEISQDLIDYAHVRVSGIRFTRDPGMHRRIGLWTQAIRTLAQQNLADLEYLVWCQDKLSHVGLTKLVEVIENKIHEFSHGPPDYYTLMMKAQAEDSREKEREEKTR